MLIALLPMLSNAADEQIQIEYVNLDGTTETKTYQASEKITLPTKDDIEFGKALIWYSEDGRAWEGGVKAYFTESVKITAIEVYDVANAEEFKTRIAAGDDVRLLSDISLSGQTSQKSEDVVKIFLNGKTITVTGTNYAFGNHRAGIQFMGAGKINFTPTNMVDGGASFMYLKTHGTNGELSQLFVGRDVVLNAPTAYLGYDEEPSPGVQMPIIDIYGTVKAYGILKITTAPNRTPLINIHQHSFCTFSGNLFDLAGENLCYVTVDGGTIVMTKSSAFFAHTGSIYTITGGSFQFSDTNNEADSTALNEVLDTDAYQINELTHSQKKYKCITTKNTKAHWHSFSLTDEVSATCNSCSYKLYTCHACENFLKISYGQTGAHSFGDVPFYIEPATKYETGIQKIACDICYSTKIEFAYFSPVDETVTFIYNGQEKTCKLGELCSVTQQGTLITVIAVIAPEGYELDKITAIEIPVGITGINIETENAYLKSLKIGKDATTTVTKLDKLTALETLEIDDASVVIKGKALPNSIKSIVSSVAGASVTFETNACLEKTSLTTLTMSSGSEYKFGKDSFKKTGIVSLSFPDGASITFTGDESFGECASLKTVYAGIGTKAIDKKAFKSCASVEKIILMDVDTIGEYCFSGMKNGVELYFHKNKATISANAFNDSDGITVYTTAHMQTGFEACDTFEIHYGVPHKYEEKTNECGGVYYEVDCPCGENKNTIYKKFVNVTTAAYEYSEVWITNVPSNHNGLEGFVLDRVEYPNGYDRLGVGTYVCTKCGGEETDSAEPIIIFSGYSVSEYNNAYSIMAGYSINNEALLIYNDKSDVDLRYGVLAYSYATVGDTAPLLNSGTRASNSIVARELTTVGVERGFAIKISEFSEAMQEHELVLSAYVIDASGVHYIQAEQADLPSYTTYRQIDLSSSQTVVPLPKTKE